MVFCLHEAPILHFSLLMGANINQNKSNVFNFGVEISSCSPELQLPQKRDFFFFESQVRDNVASSSYIL